MEKRKMKYEEGGFDLRCKGRGQARADLDKVIRGEVDSNEKSQKLARSWIGSPPSDPSLGQESLLKLIIP